MFFFLLLFSDTDPDFSDCVWTLQGRSALDAAAGHEPALLVLRFMRHVWLLLSCRSRHSSTRGKSVVQRS